MAMCTVLLFYFARWRETYQVQQRQAGQAQGQQGGAVHQRAQAHERGRAEL